jgi:glycosyltransferase involved in cell wall biosynthesis
VVDDDALRERLRVAGLERAAQFRWDDVAARHVAVYRRVRTARIAR